MNNDEIMMQFTCVPNGYWYCEYEIKDLLYM